MDVRDFLVRQGSDAVEGRRSVAYAPAGTPLWVLPCISLLPGLSNAKRLSRNNQEF